MHRNLHFAFSSNFWTSKRIENGILMKAKKLEKQITMSQNSKTSSRGMPRLYDAGTTNSLPGLFFPFLESIPCFWMCVH
jgi:hypothetical protein